MFITSTLLDQLKAFSDNFEDGFYGNVLNCAARFTEYTDPPVFEVIA